MKRNRKDIWNVYHIRDIFGWSEIYSIKYVNNVWVEKCQRFYGSKSQEMVYKVPISSAVGESAYKLAKIRKGWSN